jgi:hypothetical protein
MSVVDQYDKLGWAHVQLRGYEGIVKQWLNDWGHLTLQRRDKQTGGCHGGYGVKRTFRDQVIDGEVLLQHHLFRSIYSTVRRMVESTAGGIVVESPWMKSAITLKVYDSPGDQHGWHVESNSVTGLLYLTGVEGAALEIADPNIPRIHRDEDQPVMANLHHPTSGTLIVLRGHDVWHRVLPKKGAEPRIVLVCNYYRPGDIDRPSGIDEQHYGAA